MKNERYYISSGAKTKMYTLRVKYDENVYVKNEMGTACVGVKTRDYHVRNLSTDAAKAEAKAFEHTGQHLKVSFSLDEINRRTAEEMAAIDHSVIRFGKYDGMKVEEVYEIDPEYLMWVADSYTSKKNEKTIDIIKKMVHNDVVKRDEQLKTEAQKEGKLKAKRAEIVKEVAQVLISKAPKSPFCGDIGINLMDGILPKGRALTITIDIMGKEQGRRNSKKYKAECERVEALFTKAKEI